jgi:hypothetical protein
MLSSVVAVLSFITGGGKMAKDMHMYELLRAMPSLLKQVKE